jgi:hypothetical protein
MATAQLTTKQHREASPEMICSCSDGILCFIGDHGVCRLIDDRGIDGDSINEEQHEVDVSGANTMRVRSCACITHFFSLQWIKQTKGAGETMYQYYQYVFILMVTRVSWLLGCVCKKHQRREYHLLGSGAVP